MVDESIGGGFAFHRASKYVSIIVHCVKHEGPELLAQVNSPTQQQNPLAQANSGRNFSFSRPHVTLCSVMRLV